MNTFSPPGVWGRARKRQQQGPSDPNRAVRVITPHTHDTVVEFSPHRCPGRLAVIVVLNKRESVSEFPGCKMAIIIPTPLGLLGG